MNKRRLTQRRERLRAIAVQDAANRCVFCRRALTTAFQILLTADGLALRFCRAECREDWQALCALKAARS